MTKAELIAAIAEETGKTKADAEKFMSATLETIEKTLKKGDSISLIGFGTFSVGKRAARTGRNPQTGEPLKIAASKSVKFSAGKKLKEAVNKKKK
ncbi:MAG: HU family DNA-binding protein [SAR324 cluster bacterium]|nr:HU family DNA-binding protein [SAR324 cluster bacterium]